MAREIPVIGFGTMTLKENLCVELVEAALHLGYRHLDTAQNYGNEREVGAGLRASGVKREDVFLTTKVWFNRLAPGDLERSVDESLERLKLPWVDLLLIHWPNAQIPLAESIAALCKVKRAGLAKHIGVANFNIAMIDEAAKAGERAAGGAADRNPSLSRSDQGHSPRRAGTAWRWSAIVRWRAARCRATRCCNASAAPTANRRRKWRCASSNRRSIIPIPRTSKRERLAENLGSLEFKLSGRRDGGDRQAEAAGLAHRQPAAGAAMG